MELAWVTGAVPEGLLEADLEYALLLPDPSLRALHLERERRRVRRILAEGGFGLGSGAVMGLVRPLGWDSAHFGVACADLSRVYIAPGAPAAEVAALLAGLVEEAARRGVHLLSARLPSGRLEAMYALEGAGFRLVDTSVELGGLRPLPSAPTGADLAVRAAAAQDLPALRAIAATFKRNRFHADPRIVPEKARGVYESWVVEAAAGRRGWLLVAERAGEVAGFATCQPADDELGVDLVGLVAVHPAHRGAGVLAALCEGCARRTSGRALATSTQVSNTAALRGFARSGLLPFAARHILHGWL